MSYFLAKLLVIAIIAGMMLIAQYCIIKFLHRHDKRIIENNPDELDDTKTSLKDH